MFATALHSRAALKCVASCQKKSSSESPITAARKRFESQRQQVAKDTFNKLSAIAAADMKQVTDFLVELDTLHKKEFMSKKDEKSEPDNIFDEADGESTSAGL